MNVNTKDLHICMRCGQPQRWSTSEHDWVCSSCRNSLSQWGSSAPEEYNPSPEGYPSPEGHLLDSSPTRSTFSFKRLFIVLLVASLFSAAIPAVGMIVGMLVKSPSFGGCSDVTSSKHEPSKSKTDPNAQDIIDVVKHYHSKARAYSSFTSGFAEIADSAFTPKKLNSKLTLVYEFLAHINRKILVTPGAKTPCGKKVEAAFLKYLRDTFADAMQWRRWYDKHKAILLKLMRRKRVAFGKAREICTEKKKCSAEPVSLVSYSVINTVACPSQYFECTNGFTCHFQRIYGVIIGQPTQGYSVKVKSTGRAL